eukprot:COSAG03_NODE_8591_length_789_cov_6.298423_1_plen_187_part_10
MACCTSAAQIGLSRARALSSPPPPPPPLHTHCRSHSHPLGAVRSGQTWSPCVAGSCAMPLPTSPTHCLAPTSGHGVQLTHEGPHKVRSLSVSLSLSLSPSLSVPLCLSLSLCLSVSLSLCLSVSLSSRTAVASGAAAVCGSSQCVQRRRHCLLRRPWKDLPGRRSAAPKRTRRRSHTRARAHTHTQT